MADKKEIRFQRANYIVSDLQESLKFYRDVLGFEVEFEKDSEEDSYSYPVFNIDCNAKMRWATLTAPGQPRVMALTQIKGMDLPPVPAPRRAAIVLDIADIDGVVGGAQKLGLTVYDEERLETHDGRIGREVGIIDADDNLVVIYHIPPGVG